jgi:superoxide dismutase, Fe-Mn family
MFTLPDLPYSYDALEPFIDNATMEIHHDKHHAAYVKNLNEALVGADHLLSQDINDLIKDLSQVPEEIRTKVLNNGGGHANHTFFWEILKKNDGSGPEGALLEKINQDLGGVEKLKEDFTKAAVGRFGSGWAWVVLTPEGKLEITDTPNQNSPLSEGKTPILGLDVWEHAYYLKYQNKRAEYIEAFWNIINWEKVSEIFESSKV